MIRGIVQGKTIELERETGLQNGQAVTVSVLPISEALQPGEGIRRSAGAWDETGTSYSEIPEGIKQARAAFRRDLPSLLADRKMRGKYVCYHKDGCAAIARTYDEIMLEFARRDFPEDEYLVEKVVPGERLDEEEFERTFVELDEEAA